VQTATSPAIDSGRASRTVVLVGFQENGNLGVGYLTSVLRQGGYRVEVIDFERDPQEILDIISGCNPMIVGFSLIFQLYIDRFEYLIRFLRDRGVRAHFTMGGHFPTLSYERTLGLLPELDSVVRYEGEYTLLEMADVISNGGDWRSIDGIAHRSGGQVVATPMRSLVANLDDLPFPDRNYKAQTVLGRRQMQIVASRGCARTCSFCSIHTFYRSAPGKVVRTRNPAEVVREMQTLYDERGISIFSFQDDDFPLFGPVWHRWTRSFLSELHRAGLPGRAIWKISCRADAVDPELFAEMREAGLYLVYMGLESGTEDGLKTLNKKMTVEQNLRAVEVLKALDLSFEFGFMLFDPSTTFESMAENLAFLRTVIGDGSDALSFCRMIPYDGTPIKDELARQGRLHGTVTAPDYDFLDPRIDALYRSIRGIVEVTGWVHALYGVSSMLNYARNELSVAERLFPALEGTGDYRQSLREITRESNEILLSVVSDFTREHAGGAPATWTLEALRDRSEVFKERLMRDRDAYVLRNQETMFDAIARERSKAWDEIALTEVSYTG
jgi:anaerobic magnesium-protoporphyrin IX monomethyl ester cyclase